MVKIQNFTDLDTWKEAHDLVLLAYKITDFFPKKENYILTSQILRAGISITSNIAEGFSRGGKKEKIQFYRIAVGSLTELRNQLILAKDLGYVDQGRFETLHRQTVVVQKLLHGLIKGVVSYRSQYS